MSNNVSISIGSRIRQRRTQLRISQGGLSSKCGKSSPVWVSLIEDGKRRISVQDIIRMAHALGTTVSHLVGESDQPKGDVQFAIRASDNLLHEDKNCLLYLYEQLRICND